MFDLVKFRLDNISDEELQRIVKNNRLQTNSKAGILYYDNDQTQNILDGYYLRVSTKGNRVDINCSLHKFWNWKHIHRQVNYNLFTMNDALKTLSMLSEVTGLDVWSMKVTYYEIGLNLYLKKECYRYMDIMQTIGVLDKKKTLYINPKYRSQSVIITEFYSLIKRVYKVYDKVAEMRSKNQNTPADVNILRIETIRKRVEKVVVKELFKPPNLLKLSDTFLSDWRTLQFDSTIDVPKGTHQWKIDICKDILRNGLDTALNNLDQKGRTPKQLRTSKEFIFDGWSDFKKSVRVVQSHEEIEYRDVLYKTLRLITYRKVIT